MGNDEIIKLENKIKRNNLKYETNKYDFDFQQFKSIRFHGDSFYTGKINIDKGEINQTNL